MSFQIQPNAPQVTVGGITVAIGAFEWVNPVGEFYQLGVYQQDDAGWMQIYQLGDYGPGYLLADIQAKGGMVKFTQWAVSLINAFLATKFGQQPIPVTEPTTDEQAKQFVTTSINALKFTIIQGIPVLG